VAGPIPLRVGGGGVRPRGPANSSSNATTWLNVSAASVATPPCVGDGTLAYDALQGEFVSFGGVAGCGSSNYVGGDTWTYANGNWTNISSSLSTAPAPRYGMAMAYDAAAGYVVAFGGNSGNGSAFGDTWTFNGTWTDITSNLTTSPGPLFNAGVVYDNATRSVLLVGGYSGSYTNLNTTWSFSGGQWALVPTVSAIPPVRAPGLIYDPTTSSVLLYGGMGNVGPLGETWSFANGNWTQLFPTTSPPALWDMAAFFDANSGAPTVFGGYTGYVGSYYPAAGTWTYSSGNWTNISSSVTGAPSPRGAARVAWDPGAALAFLFGGRAIGAAGLLLNDSWEYLQLQLRSAALAASPNAVDLGSSIELATVPFGGATPFTFVYTGLPSGCATQNLSEYRCTPNATGSFLIGVNVTDGIGTSVTANTSLTVSPSLSSNLSASVTDLDVGQNVTFDASSSGGAGAIPTRIGGFLYPARRRT
jgi:Kelch motif